MQRPPSPEPFSTTDPAQRHLICGALSGSRPAKCHVLGDTLPEAGGLGCTAGASTPALATAPARATAVIELRVRNHAGAMSHITGLFARRAFNLEAIICAPNAEDVGATSRMLLLVASDDARLEQIERQLAKLYDVLEVRHRADLDREFFLRTVADVSKIAPAAGRRSPV